MKGKDIMLKIVLVADLAPLGKRNMAQEAADAGIVLSRHPEYSTLIPAGTGTRILFEKFVNKSMVYVLEQAQNIMPPMYNTKPILLTKRIAVYGIMENKDISKFGDLIRQIMRER